MILCLVTDRRRLGESLGLPQERWIEALRRQVEGASLAGIDYIQVREPDLEAGQLVELVRSLMPFASGRTRILVNDRIDVAIAAGASGVHLKEQSILPAEVRRITPPGFVIGCSIHGVSAVSARKSADLLIAGTVRPTASKPAVEYLDEDGLRRIVDAAAGQPVLGIGGLDSSQIPLLVASGASGMAAVGAFIPNGRDSVAEFVQKRVEDLRFALESASRRTVR
jgi:thiamine-phosphate pyrophosphorylase